MSGLSRRNTVASRSSETPRLIPAASQPSLADSTTRTVGHCFSVATVPSVDPVVDDHHVVLAASQSIVQRADQHPENPLAVVRHDDDAQRLGPVRGRHVPGRSATSLPALRRDPPTILARMRLSATNSPINTAPARAALPRSNVTPEPPVRSSSRIRPASCTPNFASRRVSSARRAVSSVLSLAVARPGDSSTACRSMTGSRSRTPTAPRDWAVGHRRLAEPHVDESQIGRHHGRRLAGVDRCGKDSRGRDQAGRRLAERIALDGVVGEHEPHRRPGQIAARAEQCKSSNQGQQEGRPHEHSRPDARPVFVDVRVERKCPESVGRARPPFPG